MVTPPADHARIGCPGTSPDRAAGRRATAIVGGREGMDSAPRPATALLGELPPGVTVEVYDVAGAPASDPAEVEFWLPPFLAKAGAWRYPAMPDLRVVQLLSAGAEAWIGKVRAGATLRGARGVHDSSTAEWMLDAILA